MNIYLFVQEFYFRMVNMYGLWRTLWFLLSNVTWWGSVTWWDSIAEMNPMNLGIVYPVWLTGNCFQFTSLPHA